MTMHDWSVTHVGSGRGVYTRVQLADGRCIKFSGRLKQQRAVDLATEQLRQWTLLDMVNEGFAAFERTK